MEFSFKRTGRQGASPFRHPQIDVRDLDRLKKQVETLTRAYGVSGLRTGNVLQATSGGVHHANTIYQPFWTKITGREDAFEATLLQDVDDQETTFSVSHDESKGACPHQMPFYAHLTSQNDFETVLVTKVEEQSDGSFEWTVTRQQQCTSAADHKAGDKWEANIPYKWDQTAQLLVAGDRDRGNWDDFESGRKSELNGELVTPAYEVKGIKVPTDGSAKVLMWLGYDSQTYYLFTFFGGCKDDPVLPTKPSTYPSGGQPVRIGAAWVVPGACQLKYYCTNSSGQPVVRTALTNANVNQPNGVPGLNSQGRAPLGGVPRSLLAFARQFGG